MFTNNDLTKVTSCCTVLHEQPITMLYTSSFLIIALPYILLQFLCSPDVISCVLVGPQDSMSQCLCSGIHCCKFRMVPGKTTAVKYIFCSAEICRHKLCIRVDGIG